MASKLGLIILPSYSVNLSLPRYFIALLKATLSYGFYLYVRY